MNRKDLLVHSAIEIIDEAGYHNFTIKELAKHQNISEAAIYRHFHSKNEIVTSVLETYKSFFTDTKSRIESNQINALKAIEEYVSTFLDYYERHPAMITIVNSLDLLSHERDFSKIISEIVFIRLNLLTGLFQRGIDSGEFDGLVSAEAMAHLIIGTLTSVTLTWKLQGYRFSLTEKMKSIFGQLKVTVLNQKYASDRRPNEPVRTV